MMNSEYLHNLYEKLYFQQLEYKDKLHNRIQVIFGLIVFIGTIITYVIKNISFNSGLITPCIVLFFLIISFVILFFSCLILKRCFFGNKYKQLGTPEDINKYLNELIEREKAAKEYCSYYGTQLDEDFLSDVNIREYICDELISSVSDNMKLNDKRSEEIYKATNLMFKSVIPLIIAVAIFLIADLDATSVRNSNNKQYIIVTTEKL
ncbi:TPA: hypothetical protein PXP20_004043 [Yersinia enterocolitica]|nr:hypothetical protein [Yersinia enterocolitica]